jgi:hypothetical protein
LIAKVAKGISTGSTVDGNSLRRYRDYRNAIEPRRARSGPAQHIESGAAAGSNRC